MLIDTHCHLYTDAFDLDRQQVVERSIQADVQYIILPGIDAETHSALMRTSAAFPHFCLPAIGLHPTSVSTDYESELDFLEQQLKDTSFIAIGEVGIDGYWSQEFIKQQCEAFERQLEWAAHYNLPVIIHSRSAFDKLFELLYLRRSLNIRGVFHAFSGNYQQFRQLQKCGTFKIGIGGVLTYKNAGLAQTVAKIDPSFFLLETDAPWLTPVPHRGQRNESAYLSFIAQRLSEILEKPYEEIACITTQNACSLFNIS
ncbi:MAG: TatD family hydrolase [Bacteroidetes bacterium]|nr:TatD family hydrolase [Bacteroidota bacterium]